MHKNLKSRRYYLSYHKKALSVYPQVIEVFSKILIPYIWKSYGSKITTLFILEDPTSNDKKCIHLQGNCVAVSQ